MALTMKKTKSIALISAIALGIGLFSACGNGGSSDTPLAPTSGGKVLNIYTWNDEFRARVEKYYLPDHPLPDGVTINWITTPNADMGYQTKLDQTLPNNASAAADDRADIFLVEADYAIKYTDTKYALPLSDIGISESELTEMYNYTLQLGRDKQGVLKGISWQAAPNLFIYRRSIATDVMGSDDPVTVQEAIKDWDRFAQTASLMEEKGYFMLSGYDDSFRAFSNAADHAIVEDGVISVPDAWLSWVDQTKDFSDKGYNQRTRLWDTAWGAGMAAEGKVFGYFAAPWFINFTLLDYAKAPGNDIVEIGNGSVGDWAVTDGPASSYWGGTWICAAEGTDNKDEVASIIRVLCTDPDVMKRIATDPGVDDYTNNKQMMNDIANSDFSSATLGGQNPFPYYVRISENIDVSKTISAYNQLAETFQTVMADYFSGAISKDAAIENFYTAAKEKYPELKRES
jgi:hypothetical protein